MEWGVAWNTLAHGIIGTGYMMLQGQDPRFGFQLTCSCEPQVCPKVQAVFIPEVGIPREHPMDA